MSAGGALQAALAEALAGEPRLSGIYDGPPARTAFPYAVIDAGNESDWSHKSGDGREVLVGLTVWDEEPARLAELADIAETLAQGVAAIAANLRRSAWSASRRARRVSRIFRAARTP